VAELTIALMLASLRSITQADRSLRNGIWHRISGRRLAELTVGIIGVGRVGKRVIRHINGFGSRILANDLVPDLDFGNLYGSRWATKEEIYRQADLISLHLPLTAETRGLIARREMKMMSPGVVLVNTSRGGMINEHDLAEALSKGHVGAAALDVFSQEPYSGELVTHERCLLTCHMGSMSRDCRTQMELEATADAIRFLKGEPVRQLVPEDEYSERVR
jgi:D-3-phosphoglycerate dehydrogenase